MNQREATFETLAIHPELQISLRQHRRCFRLCAWYVLAVLWNGRKRLPRAYVPNHDRACAIVTFRDDAFEVEVRDRMVFHLHCETLVCRVERWSFGHGP